MAAAPPPPQAPTATSTSRPSVGLSGSIYLLRGLATVMVILASVIYILLIADPDSDLYLIGLIILIAGMGLGAGGIWIGNIKMTKSGKTTLNLLFLGIALILTLAGAIIMGSKLDLSRTLPISSLVYVLLYGFFMMSFIEFSHSSYRFTDIDHYARTHELKGFSMAVVVNNYFIRWGILMGIVFVISFLVLATNYGLLLAIAATNEAFGASIELNSIYLFAIAVAVWFIPLGVFASIIFGEGSLIKSSKTIFIKSESAAGPEMLGLQTIEHPEDMRK